MAYRRKVSRRVDRRVFAQTSKKTKSINVSPYAQRGGVRL